MSSVGLIGFMGAGKTHVGRIVADRLGWPFVDLDAVLAERHGRPAASLLEAVGEPEFRRLEQEALELVSDGPAQVVATGGGVVVTPACREILRRRFRTVFLDAPWPTLVERTRNGVGRPLWDDRVEQRFAERLPWYRAADVTVDGARPADDVAADVVRAVTRRDVTVAPQGLPPTRAVVDLLDWEGLEEAVGDPAVLVTDATVDPSWAARVRERVPALRRTEPVVLPAGEAAKSVVGWERCIDGLLAAGVDRTTTLVALGGGALGDVAGFAAATLLRGIPWVVLPTTLLSMVDSSIGGKVAIDHASGKNLIGAFHPPRLVWAALPALTTLPAVELRSGLAEVVKTAVVADADLLAFVEAHAAALSSGDPHVLFPVVERCVRAKARIVEEDPRDTTGSRARLNAGHTVGHAVEHLTGCRHGEAVAVGLVAEARFAVRRGFCLESDLPDRLVSVFAALGLETRLPDVDAKAFVAAVQVDKKRSGDTLVLPLPVEAGRAGLARIPLAATAELLSR